jgi:hypothetical protein
MEVIFMKRLLKIWGIIAFAAIIGFVLLGCVIPGGDTPTLNEGAVFASSSTLGGVQLRGIDVSGAASEVDTNTINVEIPRSLQKAVKFVHNLISGSERAAVTAYVGSSSGGGEYAEIKTDGYDFSGNDKTFWIKVVSEDEQTTQYYRITVTISNILQSGSELSDATLGGIPIDFIYDADSDTEAAAVLGEVTIERQSQAGAMFEYNLANPSNLAKVSAKANDGSEGGDYTDITSSSYSFNAMENSTLWVKVTAEDESVSYYKFAVTVPEAESGTGAAVITLTMDEFTMTDEGTGVFNPGSISLDRNNEDTVIVNANGVEVIEWRLGNIIMSIENSVTLNAVYLETGSYILNLSFNDGTKTWNGELRFTVTE